MTRNDIMVSIPTLSDHSRWITFAGVDWYPTEQGCRDAGFDSKQVLRCRLESPAHLIALIESREHTVIVTQEKWLKSIDRSALDELLLQCDCELLLEREHHYIEIEPVQLELDLTSLGLAG
ncbi:hypothetical protein [Salinibius halmophilus]|uniref:hypothetical protein n=1 Tax=Salinibius halmophilus TaxID=1853216 RepID=UPI000E6705E2|nr:hypothetical protein [Salinibius halmophilus]